MTDVYGKSVASIESTDDEKFGKNGGFTAVLSTPSLDRDGDRLFRDEWLSLPEWLPLDVDHGMTVADTIGKFHPYWDDDRMLMDAYFASTPKAQEYRTIIDDLSDEDGGGCPLGVSVAFMTDKSKKDSEPRRELLNAGLVAIPSNRDAVILASKAASALKDAFAHADEGEVPSEVREAVLEALGTKTTDKELEEGYAKLAQDPETKKSRGVFIDVHPRIDYEKFVKEIADGLKAEGGGDTALKQAIHDAAIHLGAICFPVVTDEDPSGASEGANKTADEVETEQVDTQRKSEELDLEALKPEGLSMEQFESALKTMLTPQDDETPEAPAPTDEVPAPASPEESDLSRRLRSLQMRARVRLQTSA